MKQAEIFSSNQLLSIQARDPSEFLRIAQKIDFDSEFILDDELSCIDCAIHLRNAKAFSISNRILDVVMKVYNKSALASFELSTLLALQGNLHLSMCHARNAFKSDTTNMTFVTQYAKALCLSGNFDLATSVCAKYRPVTLRDRLQSAEISQFVAFCRNFCPHDLYSKLLDLEESSRYLRASNVIEKILHAIKEDAPYSLVRLGDGEGAWIKIDAFEEGLYNDLYKSNRNSFLLDWFGNTLLSEEDGFHELAYSIQSTYSAHDIIGIPPTARMMQEFDYLSMRGVPSSINALRITKALDSTCNHKFCSNSINLIMYGEGSFNRLFSAHKNYSLITSHAGLADIFDAGGLKIDKMFLVPGDSRNFWAGDFDVPQCQYPSFCKKINEEIVATDQRSRVFLVAAGFVGKTYLKTIRERGGIAIDIGSVADIWAEKKSL